MKICISSDSTCDLTSEQIKENDIRTMPLIVNLGDDSFIDGETVFAKDIFAYVDKTGTLPKTAARGIEEYKEYFEKIKTEYDAVVHISLSSEMSSSFNNARMGADGMENVFVVDSLNLSSGTGLLVLLAVDMRANGSTAQEIADAVKAKTANVCASFIINNLKYLYKGGRCSALALFGANLLKIKPSIEVKEGKMGVAKKYMGKMNDVLSKYLNDIVGSKTNIDKTRVFITYSSKETADTEILIEKLKLAGFQNVIESNASCTICSHCGPETLGILFLTK